MDRRTFIKKTGLLTGAAIALPLSGTKAQTSTTKTTFKAAKTSVAKPAINTGIRQWTLVSAFNEGTVAGDQLEDFVKFVAHATDNRLRIQVFHAGQLVQPKQCMTAVQTGKAQMGFGSPNYWKTKNPALPFIAGMPFGLVASEQNAWLYHGGGLELVNSIYQKLGLRYFPMGNTGVQMGGWFKKEIRKPADLRDLTMRISGLGGKVLNSLGTNTVSMSGSQIVPAMRSGKIDAAEWIGPYEDLKKEFYLAAKYYYYPGWHDTGSVRDCFIDLEEWQTLPDEQKKIIEYGASNMNMQTKAKLQALNHTALRSLTEEYGVKLRPFSTDLLTVLGNRTSIILPTVAAKHPDSLKVYNHIIRFRESMLSWSNYSEQAFMAARTNARL